MRILIADDDPTSVLLLQNTLSDWGYEVVTVRDGTEAWNALRRPDAPRLVILDWMMPGLNGIEVCHKVRQDRSQPYIYLLMLTARTDKQSIIEGMAAGADDYVAKPFDEQELHVRVRSGQRIIDLEEKLRVQATQDALTRIWNRNTILQILARELARAVREGTSLGARSPTWITSSH